MKFADFHAGQVIETASAEVREADVLAFARDWDPQWFHTDAARAQAGPFGGLIASGWHTCAIAMRLMVDEVLHDSESYASPGLRSLKWLQPVRPGDRLRVVATVIDARRSAKNPAMGVLHWRWQVHNQHGAVVLDIDASNLFRLQTPSGPGAPHADDDRR